MQAREAIAVAALLAVACPGHGGTGLEVSRRAGPAVVLAEGGWLPANREVLEAWIRDVARRGEPAVAVFDWDETSICGDAGMATFYHQLDRLAIRMDPEALGEQVPERVSYVTVLEGGVALADLRADLLEAWSELWPLVRAGDVEAARRLEAHRDFRAKAAWLYDALEATPGIGATFAYPWLAGWLAGHTEAEARALAAEAVEAAAAEPRGLERWEPETAGRAGRLAVVRRTGLAAQPEMWDLMAALERAGVRVFVVSASAEPIVEAAAAALGYPIRPEAIFGIRLAPDGGRLSRRALDPASYPLAYREGKAELVRALLPGPPLLVAGDADTDYEMLTAFPETEIRLLVNRSRGGDIGSLYADALEPPARPGPVTILQGRDENRCAFHPLRETTPLGAETPTPLAARAGRR